MLELLEDAEAERVASLGCLVRLGGRGGRENEQRERRTGDCEGSDD
jgi:hypothetical protein